MDKKKAAIFMTTLLPFLVNPTEGVSNFLDDDYDAILKFLNAETQKKKLKL